MSAAHNQIVTRGIVLSRTDYGEADRIITLITPDQGKLRLMAKGVRRLKSKLAGGIELFSISSITFIPGRGDIGTLISSRLTTHYGEIIKDIERVQVGYELIKLLHKITEDNSEEEYYDLLQQSFEALNDPTISLDLISTWFTAQLLRIGGHSPNLQTDMEGIKLEAANRYNFDPEAMTFFARPDGKFDATTIKFLRILLSNITPAALARIENIEKHIAIVQGNIQAMRQLQLHV